MQLAFGACPDPIDKPLDAGGCVLNLLLLATATVAIDQTRLVTSGRPVNADKPHEVITHRCVAPFGPDRPWRFIALVLALAARLPTGCAPRTASTGRKSPLGTGRAEP